MAIELNCHFTVLIRVLGKRNYLEIIVTQFFSFLQESIHGPLSLSVSIRRL